MTTETQRPYPLLCRPVLKSKIWGGRKLESLPGLELPPGEAVGEAWIAADLPEGASWIANGPLAGETLSRAASLWGEDLIGAAWRGRPTGGRFPLLVKFLDAQDDLSVQVHPDDAACREHFPGDFSKDESWVILHAAADGAILYGFEEGATLDDFDRLIGADRVEECIRRILVRPGDVFRIAPGTVHALCGGVVILEIQEPSDTTFRIYDYGRKGDDGKPRPLHLDAARKVMRFGDDENRERLEPALERTDWGTRELLVDVSAYRIERLQVEAPVEWSVQPSTAQVVVVTDGGGRLEVPAAGPATGSLELTRGSCVILPALSGPVRFTPAEGAGCRIIVAGAGGVPLTGGY